MQELLWEIWMGKRNTHHRAQVDLSENPHSTFLRIARELKGSDKEVPLTRRDPNTGQTMEVKWKFSWRSEGKEIPLKNHQAFAQQGVAPDALIVVREVEVRAHTIYIDGFDGLGVEEIAAARSKVPLIVGFLLFLLLAGGAGYYFLVAAPAEKARAPYKVAVMTAPEGAKIEFFLDMSKVPKAAPTGPPTARKAAKKTAAAAPKEETLKRIAMTTPAKAVLIPKKSQIVFISISLKGHQTWTAGYPLKQWNKDRAGLRKLVPIDPKEVTVKGYFPKTLEKKKPAPTFRAVPPPAPRALVVKYPRRWRRFKLGLDPLHGGVGHDGIASTSSKTSADHNLAIAKVLMAQAKTRAKKRKFRVYASRTKDEAADSKLRAKRLRRASAVIQLDFHSGIKELPKANKTLKVNMKMVPYNDSVGGFLVYYSAQNKAVAKAQKLAGCVGSAMKQAGFTPRAPRKGEPATAATLGVRPLATKDAVLNGKQAAVRLIPGYLSHRGADAAFNKPATYVVLAQVVESAMICYRKR